jgi:hypothetical protein
MENKCSLCGITNKLGSTLELVNGKFICIKCFRNMSKKEQGNIQDKLIIEDGTLSQNNIDALLSFIDDGEERGNTFLRIGSWNCHWGLNVEKYEKIMKYFPQILIIQECKKTDFDYIKNMWKYKNWYCDDLYTDESEYGSENGVAIFSNNYEIKFTEIFNRKYRYVIPYEISNNEYKFILFAVWIKPVRKNYLKPLYEAIEFYRNKKMFDNNSLFIGDFNSFAKDEEALEVLEKKLSPLLNCAKNSKDSLVTFTYYHGNNNYGINDFCFASKDITEKINVYIPSGWDKKKSKEFHWNGLSDHSPIIVDMKM